MGTSVQQLPHGTVLLMSTDITTFYYELSSFVRNIPKDNDLIIGRDMNAHRGEVENKKFSIHNSVNSDGEDLTIMNYLPLSKLFLKTTFWSLLETWMLIEEKLKVRNSVYTTQ